MIDRALTEPIELEVEQLSYVPGQGVHRLARTVRWWDASFPATTGQAAMAWPSPAPGTVATTVLTGSASFWRIVDVPGDELGRVLGAWWSRSDHDDGRLRLCEPHCVDGSWELGGSLRMTSVSHRFAVDLRFSSHLRYWSRLELTPRHPIRPSRRYFRIGHDALDRLVATLREMV